MRSCLTDEELFALVDGALAPKDSELLREHLRGCSRCSDAVKRMERSLAGIAEAPAIDVRAHADSVMSAIDRSLPASPRSRFLPIALSTLAVAAALVLGIRIGRHSGEDGFVARGGAQDPAVGHSVAVTLHAIDGSSTRKVSAGASLSAGTRFVASHRNSGRAPAYALVFGVDSRGEVHWLYPAYEAAGSDPASVSLEPTQGREESMESAVAFDDLAPGRLSLVTILTREPLSVSRVESRSKDRAKLEADALRSAFPEATVTYLDVSILPR